MKKSKTFRPWNPEQTLLLPPSPVEWLPANHLVFFLLDIAAELDLSAIYAVYEALARHQPAEAIAQGGSGALGGEHA